MGHNSCQPEGLQPESAMAALLVLAIERLLPSPGALPSPILAAMHTSFIMLGTPETCIMVAGPQKTTGLSVPHPAGIDIVLPLQPLARAGWQALLQLEYARMERGTHLR